MASPSPGFSNPGCYAQVLGECSADITCEHYISEALLRRVGEDGTVFVSNLGFQPRNLVREMPVATLYGRVLCERHNHYLSHAVDPSVLPLYDGVEHMHLPGEQQRTFRVDGDAVERWMLKMLCGGLFSGNVLVPPEDNMRRVYPPDEWARIIFRNEELPPLQGLYLMLTGPGAAGNPNQIRLRVTPLLSQGDEFVLGVRVWMFDIEFLLMAMPPRTDVPTVLDGGVYRPAGLIAHGGNTRIEVSWRHGPAAAAVEFRRDG
jgi:hypothetical protein